MNEDTRTEESKKKRSLLKYVLYIVVVLLATGLSLFFSLKDNFNTVIDAFAKSDDPYILLILASSSSFSAVSTQGNTNTIKASPPRPSANSIATSLQALPAARSCRSIR